MDAHVEEPPLQAWELDPDAPAFHLRVAAQAHGVPLRVETLPDGDGGDLVAPRTDRGR